MRLQPRLSAGSEGLRSQPHRPQESRALAICRNDVPVATPPSLHPIAFARRAGRGRGSGPGLVGRGDGARARDRAPHSARVAPPQGRPRRSPRGLDLRAEPRRDARAPSHRPRRDRRLRRDARRPGVMPRSHALTAQHEHAARAPCTAVFARRASPCPQALARSGSRGCELPLTRRRVTDCCSQPFIPAPCTVLKGTNCRRIRRRTTPPRAGCGLQLPCLRQGVQRLHGHAVSTRDGRWFAAVTRLCSPRYSRRRRGCCRRRSVRPCQPSGCRSGA